MYRGHLVSPTSVTLKPSHLRENSFYLLKVLGEGGFHYIMLENGLLVKCVPLYLSQVKWFVTEGGRLGLWPHFDSISRGPGSVLQLYFLCLPILLVSPGLADPGGLSQISQTLKRPMYKLEWKLNSHRNPISLFVLGT